MSQLCDMAGGWIPITIGLVFIASLAFMFWICLTNLTNPGISAELPWANDKHGSTSRVGLFIRSILNSHTMLEQGYNAYSKQGMACIFANLFTGAEVLLPLHYMDCWYDCLASHVCIADSIAGVHDQPESVLSSFEAHRQFMRADWTFLHPTIFHEHVFERVIKNQLTRHLDDLMPYLADETLRAVTAMSDASLDGGCELTDHSSWKKITLQVVSRIYVGEPLCRNKTYLARATSFNDLSMLVAAIIGVMPAFLRPILAPIVCLRNKWNHHKCAAMTKPLIEARLKDMLTNPKADLPNDLITWSIQDAFLSDQQGSYKRTPDFLAARISMMNFVSIDSTSITIENTIYDILSNPSDLPPQRSNEGVPRQTLLECIRAEIQAAYDTYNGNDPLAWKRIINSLPILDACLKESLRLNNFISRTNVRMVVSPDGLDIPNVGKVAKGTNVAFSLWAIHHDEDSYLDAYTWRMSRWLECPNREKMSVLGGGHADWSKQYLPFGYRRHACPGRFFALRVVKLILVHLILFYDLEMGGSNRPENPWLGVSRGPPMGSKIKLKRLKSSKVARHGRT